MAYGKICFLIFLIIPFTITLSWISTYIKGKVAKILLKALIYILNIVLAVCLFVNECIDLTSLLFGLLALIVSLPVSIYSIGYSVRRGYGAKLPLLIDVFALSMTYAFIAPNILLFAASWTIAELIGFSLISLGEEHEGRHAFASRRFLLISVLTFEITVFTLIYVSVFILVGAIASIYGLIDALLKPFWVLERYKVNVPLFILPFLLVGFITKSAIIPLHFWLPEAHSVAPSPASALLSGIMTAMGVYGLIRIFDIIVIDFTQVALALIILSILSIIYGGLQSYVQRDCKRLLAYSTIAGTGFSVMILGLYTLDHNEILYVALITSVMAHALYKSALFLNAGLIELTYGTRNLDMVGGYIRVYSTSTIASLIALFSLIGLPPTMGFISKLYAILAILSGNISEALKITVLIGVVLAIALSTLIGLRYARIYLGKLPEDARKSIIKDRSILYSELALSILNIASIVVLYMVAAGISIELTTVLVLLSLPIIIIFTYVLITISKRFLV